MRMSSRSVSPHPDECKAVLQPCSHVGRRVLFHAQLKVNGPCKEAGENPARPRHCKSACGTDASVIDAIPAAEKFGSMYPTGATALGRENQSASSQETGPIHTRIQPLEGGGGVEVGLSRSSPRNAPPSAPSAPATEQGRHSGTGTGSRSTHSSDYPPRFARPLPSPPPSFVCMACGTGLGDRAARSCRWTQL